MSAFFQNGNIHLTPPRSVLPNLISENQLKVFGDLNQQSATIFFPVKKEQS
jgi:hypothetical protein